MAIKDEKLPKLDKEVEKLKDSYHFPRFRPSGQKQNITLEEYREIKYSPTNNQWMKVHIVESTRQQLLLQLLQIVRDLDGMFVLSFYDESSDNCGLKVAQRRALENLYERIGGMTRSKNEVVITVGDFTGSVKETKRLIESATGIARFGTWYRENLHENVYPVLLTAESHMHAGLQIADVAVGSLRSMLSDEKQYAPPIWKKVAGSLYKNNSRRRGWGVKLRSKDCGRLYEKLEV